MNNKEQLLHKLSSGDYDDILLPLNAFDSSNLVAYKERIISCINEFSNLFGDEGEISLFSAPGRTEIGGNHTDHQHGCVIAASVNLDVVAIARPRNDKKVTIKSAGYDLFTVDISDKEIKNEEINTTASLIRGISARFEQIGYSVLGFDLCANSTVLGGSGLSSSAAFEVLIGTVFNSFFCESKEDAVSIAKISQYAENVYFGKPCGLMDQTASSVGGLVFIDFNNPENPIVEKVELDFSKTGYSLCIINTGGSHDDLTNDYADVTKEMGEVAAFFGKKVLRDVNSADFYKQIGKLRESTSDRAILRAIHFFADNEAALQEANAIRNGNFNEFLSLVRKSGQSSFMYLQNVYSIKNPSEQGLSLGLALCEKILGNKGAYRVHGGGFAGTIQAFVPNDMLQNFKDEIEAVFSEGSCYILSIRPIGGKHVL